MQDTACGERLAGLGLSAFVSPQVVQLPRVPPSVRLSAQWQVPAVFAQSRGAPQPRAGPTRAGWLLLGN